jgi:hypothetical protein
MGRAKSKKLLKNQTQSSVMRSSDVLDKVQVFHVDRVQIAVLRNNF